MTQRFSLALVKMEGTWVGHEDILVDLECSVRDVKANKRISKRLQKQIVGVLSRAGDEISKLRWEAKPNHGETTKG